mgnify:CR=1 FL=1
MEKFTKIKSIPSYLSLQNIDTDMIIPKQFLKTIKRTGLGKSLFYEMRYDEQGNLIKDFTLNKEPYNKSKILLAGKKLSISGYATQIFAAFFASNLLVIPAHEFCS